MLVHASKSLKWLYCLTLAATIFPAVFMGASNWIALITGGGLLSFGLVSLVLWVVVFGYRIALVVRYPATLDAYLDTTPLVLLRRLGMFLMAVAILGAIAQLLSSQIMRFLVANRGNGGIALFAIRVYAYFISSGGLFGLVLFEISRLLGFERNLRNAAYQHVST